MKHIWYIILGVGLILAGSVVWFTLTKNQTKTSGSSSPTPTPTETILEEPKSNPVSFEIPILMYHYIRVADPDDELGYALSVTPKNFDSHVNWLKNNNYISIRLADLADPQKTVIRKVFEQNKKPVVFTFDDGYADAYSQAFPILKKYDMIGTFFVIRDKVGRDDSFYMNQTQINEMEKAGMEIGSHTLKHLDLAKASLANARTEIFDSKLEATVFCYPSGRYNDTVANLVKDAGYVAAVTTEFGIAKDTSDLFKLKRVRVENGNGEYLAGRINKAIQMSKNDQNNL